MSLIRLLTSRLSAASPFVYVNTAGAADNGKNIIPFDGESLVYDPRGQQARRDRRNSSAKQLMLVEIDDDTGLSAGPVAAPPATIPPDREMYDALRDGPARLHGARRDSAGRSSPSPAGSTPRSRWPLRPTRSVPSCVAAFNMPSKFQHRGHQGHRFERVSRRRRGPLRRDSDPRDRRDRPARVRVPTRTRSPAASHAKTSRRESAVCS